MTKLLLVSASQDFERHIHSELPSHQELKLLGSTRTLNSAKDHPKAVLADVLIVDNRTSHVSPQDIRAFVEDCNLQQALIIITDAGPLRGLDVAAGSRIAYLPSSAIKRHKLTSLVWTAKNISRRAEENAVEMQTRANSTFAHDAFIAIGASTGGVDALIELLSRFPENCPPTVVTQHMPAGYTQSFTDRLNRNCAAQVAEATSGAALHPGLVFVAPGGKFHLEVTGRGRPICRLSEGPLENGHRPSVDALFRSAARFGKRAAGVILTGMGQDGAAGLLEMRRAGASTFAQDEETSLVFGMPRAALKVGAVNRCLPLPLIAPKVLNACKA